MIDNKLFIQMNLENDLQKIFDEQEITHIKEMITYILYTHKDKLDNETINEFVNIHKQINSENLKEYREIIDELTDQVNKQENENDVNIFYIGMFIICSFIMIIFD
jgi:hypothetical protein